MDRVWTVPSAWLPNNHSTGFKLKQVARDRLLTSRQAGLAVSPSGAIASGDVRLVPKAAAALPTPALPPPSAASSTASSSSGPPKRVAWLASPTSKVHIALSKEFAECTFKTIANSTDGIGLVIAVATGRPFCEVCFKKLPVQDQNFWTDRVAQCAKRAARERKDQVSRKRARSPSHPSG